jgi:hypothetical protein
MEEVGETNTKRIPNFDKASLKDLLALARERGIQTSGMSRSELVSSLRPKPKRTAEEIAAAGRATEERRARRKEKERELREADKLARREELNYVSFFVETHEHTGRRIPIRIDRTKTVLDAIVAVAAYGGRSGELRVGRFRLQKRCGPLLNESLRIGDNVANKDVLSVVRLG